MSLCPNNFHWISMETGRCKGCGIGITDQQKESMESTMKNRRMFRDYPPVIQAVSLFIIGIILMIVALIPAGVYKLFMLMFFPS